MAFRLLCLSYEYPPIGGGGAKVVDSLIENLLPHGLEIDLFTMAYQKMPRKERKGPLTITRTPCLRREKSVCHPHEMLIYLILTLPRLIRKARKRKYALNHTHFIFPDGLLAYALKKTTGIPYVITAHGSDVPGYNPDRFKLLHKLLVPVWNKVTENAETIICPSAHIAELIHSVNPRVRTTVIPNGINIRRFDPGKPKADCILVVTRMVERKGVQYLLDALAGWNCSYSVEIVGDGPYLSTLREKARNLGVRANFHGFVDNKSDEFTRLFETSKIYVFTSSSENFPVVLLEAMCAGAAIITSNDTGCAEAVGDSARLVPPKNAEAIREALQELINNPDLIADLSRRGRSRLEARFSDESVIDKHLELFRKCVEPGTI